MKYLLFFLSFNICITHTYAQGNYHPCPGNYAVMADKMNVFYMGVPNPITISAGASWDKVKISTTNCTLNRFSSSGIVLATQKGNASINFIENERTTVFNFRVKEIPNPVFKIGGKGGARMAVDEFKKQKYCIASLENFDFDARFSVVSATVYFSGTNFNTTESASIKGNSLNEISKFMERCAAGSTIIFDEVKVLGPDGKQRIIPGIGIILY